MRSAYILKGIKSDFRLQGPCQVLSVRRFRPRSQVNTIFT